MARHAAEKLKRPPANARARAPSLDDRITRISRITQSQREVATALQSQEHDTMRSLLMSAVRTWVLAQHLPQRVIADRLQVPRTAVSDIVRSKSNYAAEKLLEMWAAVGGRWELRLTLGESREKDAAAPPRPDRSGSL
jgi:predicted XRE-type DNA-binding protein